MSLSSPYPCYVFSVYDNSQHIEYTCGIRINGKLYFSFQNPSYYLTGLFKDIAASTLTEDEQRQLAHPWPTLEVDGPVWVEGMKAFKSDGTLSTEPGCYLDTVRCTIHRERYDEDFDGGVSQGIVYAGSQYDYNEEAYLLGPIPSAYNGGCKIRGLYTMGQSDTQQYQFKGNAPTQGVSIINESAPILCTTRIAMRPSLYAFGAHCVYLKDALFHTGTYTIITESGDEVIISKRYWKCTSFVNALASASSEDPEEVRYRWGFHMP